MRSKWYSYCCAYVSIYLLALVGFWLWPLFAVMTPGYTNNGTNWRVEPRLPRWLAWMQTPDNSLWGDEGWRTAHAVAIWGTYRGMAKWLLRNAAYGFAWGPLAYTPTASATYATSGDLTIRPRDHARAGSYLIVSSDGAWERTSIRQVWKLPICFKIRTGWILGDAVPGRPCLFLLSIRLMPFRV